MICTPKEQKIDLEFGVKLKKLLKNRGLTIKSFSNVSGISVNTLYGITRRGTGSIFTSTLLEIANALDIEPEELICDNATKKKKSDGFNKKMLELEFNLRQISNALQEISNILSELKEEA